MCEATLVFGGSDRCLTRLRFEQEPTSGGSEAIVVRVQQWRGRGSLLNGRSPCHLQCMMLGRLTHIFPRFLETVR